MSAPNIVNVQTITGTLAVQQVTTSATAIVTNSSSSSQVYKVNTLTISNVGASAATITVDVYRSSTPYRISYNVSVPVNATFTPIDRTAMLYLNEGDVLRLTASAANTLEATCSYEVIS